VRVFDWVRELINPMIDVRLEEKGDGATLVVDVTGGDTVRRPVPYFSESMFAAIQKFSRILLGEAPRFERLCFRHPPPPYRKAYDAYFGAPIKFRQPRYTLEMRKALLDQPLRGGFPALHEQALYRVERRLKHLQKRPGLVAAIEDAFVRRPELLGQGIEQMAAELKMHSRTLQRRLREEGQSYGDLQGRVRYRLALQMLEKPGEGIEDISERLGFSDRRSFTRAFKRWSGVSPRAFQDRGSR
jgi:AraC-like DNA-binding protein